MPATQQIVQLLFAISLAGLVAAVGLDSSLSELTSLFRRPARLAKAVLVVNVVVPIVALGLVSLFPLSPAARGGILLMAVSPVPPLMAGKAIRAGGGKAYSYGLYAALALLSTIVVPLTVSIVGGLRGVSIPLGPLAVAANVALTVMLPLAVALFVRRLWPAFAERRSSLVARSATLLLVATIIPVVISVWPAMVALAGAGTMLAMALIAALALTAGHALGGPDPGDRAALAMAAATRHPGIALMIAGAAGADRAVTAAILEFLLVGMVVALPYQMWLKAGSRRAAASRAAAG